MNFGHYDPLADAEFKEDPFIKIQMGMPALSHQLLPKHCLRTKSLYKKCLIANDDDKKLCENEGNDILAICPSFALDSMKEKNKLRLKVEAMSNKKYHSAMDVPEYNKGRTVADVPKRDWSFGERANLRPDSMWADDRYHDITQKEIDDVKERIKKRNKGKNVDQTVHLQKYDRTFEAPPAPALYP